MSIPDLSTRLIAFSNGKCVADGLPEQVVTNLKSYIDKDPECNLLILDAVTSQTIELDLRPPETAILATQFKAEETANGDHGEVENDSRAVKRGRGRPKLGVVSREVTLLPRHWDWLSGQPGGASVALRRLVEQARNANGARDKQRAAVNSCYQFMTTMAGDEPGYEEAIRALYAPDLDKLLGITKHWPPDIACHVESLASDALGDFRTDA